MRIRCGNMGRVVAAPAHRGTAAPKPPLIWVRRGSIPPGRCPAVAVGRQSAKTGPWRTEIVLSLADVRRVRYDGGNIRPEGNERGYSYSPTPSA